MAEMAISVLVSAITSRISRNLIEEYSELGVEVRHVEWIERELRSMQGLLEQIEQSRYGEQEQQLNEWAEKLKDIARDAEDVIQTFVLKTVKRRRRMVLLYWLDKYFIDKELWQIRKRMRDISQSYTRMNLSTTVSVETPGGGRGGGGGGGGEASTSSSTTTILVVVVAPAMEKLDHILSQNLITSDGEVMQIVEDAKGELSCMQNIVSNLKSASERDNVWLKEVKDICDYTADVAGNFIARREKWLKMGWLRKVLYLYEGCASAWEFKKQMMYIRTQIGDSLHRRLTYGVGGEDMGVGDKHTTLRSTPVPNLSIGILITEIFTFCILYVLILISTDIIWPDRLPPIYLLPIYDTVVSIGVVAVFERKEYKQKKEKKKKSKGGRAMLRGLLITVSFRALIDLIISFIIISLIIPLEAALFLKLIFPVYAVFVWSVDLWRSVDRNFNCVKRDLGLMHAFFSDTVSAEGLNERQKVWVGQLRLVAQNGQSLIAASPKSGCLSRIKFANDVNGLLKEILSISDRKTTYAIPNIQGPEQLVPLCHPSTRESEIVVERPIDNSAEEHPAPAASSLYLPITVLKERVQSIRGEMDLMDALFRDVQYMGELDGRCKIWVEQMRGIACEGESLVNDYGTKLEHKPILVYFFKYWTRRAVRMKIDEIIKNIEEASRRRRTYGLHISNRAIPDMSTASRLLTTCSGNAAQQLLDDENSWLMFTRHLKLYIPPELAKVGRELVMKCGGLQSEILKLTDLLSNKEVTLEEWSSLLRELNQEQRPWLETFDTINTDLPLYMRRCLHYFLLFPAEFEIPVRRLVVLWIAEGLVPHSEDLPPEQVAELCLTELIDRNIVQIAKRKPNGKVKTCRLPSALRDLWLTKASESSYLLQGRCPDPKKSIIRRVVDHLDRDDIWHDHIHGDSETRHNSASLRTYYKDVLSFLSFDTQEGSKPGQQIGNFLKRCISSDCFLLLRVLDLERVYKPELPTSIARLSRLRYLGLRWTYLESLPSCISSLLKLQTLDLKHTYIPTIPRSIWKMELRHLYLSETFRTRFPPQPKRNSLSDLQTLWGLFVDEAAPVKHGLDRLVNIRKLGLACQSISLSQEAMLAQLEAVVNWIGKLELLQTLRLKSRDEEGRPWILPLKSFEKNINLTDLYLLGTLSSSAVLSQFPQSLVELTLSHSKLQDDPMQMLKDFPNLQTLYLRAESYMGKTMFCESQSFPQLSVLKFWVLGQLEEWEIEQGALPCLKQLEIRKCLCLKTLPEGLKHVNTLLELKLTNMTMDINAEKHKIPPNCELIQLNFQ